MRGKRILQLFPPCSRKDGFSQLETLDLPCSLMVAEQVQDTGSLMLLSFQCPDGVFSASPAVILVKIKGVNTRSALSSSAVSMTNN